MDINLATLGAGWVRVYPGHPATSNLTAWNDGSLLIQATAGTVSVYIWGVQNEPGGVVHSLVPNTTGVVTCPKDVAYFSGLSIPSASRISGKFTARVAMADGNYHFLFDTRGRATGFGGCALFVEPTGAITARIQDTGVDVTLFSTAVLPWVALQTYAIALVQDGLGNAAITRDGVTVGSAAAQRILPVATFLTPGAASDSTLPLDGWVDRLTIQ
jgi:hypothetical protein